MGKLNNSLSIIGFALIVCVTTLIVRTCASEPSISPQRFASTLAVMRSDMSAALAVGGVEVAFDNNKKTQINRVSISTSIRGDTWSTKLQNGYILVLSQRGWRTLNDSSAQTLMCKDGALATIARSGADVNDGFITMTLSSATIAQCAHAAN